MAGLFYSLKETAQRLGKTEDEVKLLARDGRLREFRDGSNLLFKIDEVNALLGQGADMDFESGELETAEPAALELDDIGFEGGEEEPAALEMDDMGFEGEEMEAGEPDALEVEDIGLENIEVDAAQGDEVPLEEQTAAAFAEGAAEMDESVDEDVFALDEADADAEALTLEPMGEAELTSELGLAAEETDDEGTTAEEQELLFLAEDEPSLADDDQPSLSDSLADGTEEEISLAAESGVLASDTDISDMDTAITGAGVNVLDESSSGFSVTDDSMAETALGPAGSTGEASLEEIEDDVSLDSFGSGSGLLDLSLQADDTSLGGILDEIYTSEGGEGDASDSGPTAIAEEGGAFDEFGADVEQPVGEEDLPLPDPVAPMPATVGAAYVEALPDAQSNILGMLLFLPLLALLYTAIVTISGMYNVMPSILTSVQGIIWYILGGAIFVSLIVVAASFMAGRDRTAAPPRARKDKKAKSEKAGKKAKAEKPAKEKKSFFGRKKK